MFQCFCVYRPGLYLCDYEIQNRSHADKYTFFGEARQGGGGQGFIWYGVKHNYDFDQIRLYI